MVEFVAVYLILICYKIKKLANYKNGVTIYLRKLVVATCYDDQQIAKILKIRTLLRVLIICL